MGFRNRSTSFMIYPAVTSWFILWLSNRLKAKKSGPRARPTLDGLFLHRLGCIHKEGEVLISLSLVQT